MNKDIHANKHLVHLLFEQQAIETPNHVAVMYHEQSICYHTLNSNANQLAHYLRTIGVSPDRPVAICLPRSIELLITIMAVLKAGGVYLPIDSNYPKERLLFILNDNNTPILITNQSSQEQFACYQGLKVLIEQRTKITKNYPTTNPVLLNKLTDLAYIIYTSGSTGTPKGVLITHQSLVNYGQWFANYSHCEARQRIDFSANYIFDMAITNSIVPLLFGLTIVIETDETKKNCRRYIEFLQKAHINIIKITPSYFKVLLYELQHHLMALPALKTIILGGENLSKSDCAAWLNYYPNHRLINEYGPTEATVAVSITSIDKTTLDNYGAIIPIGKPGANSQFYLLDNDKKPVPIGQKGELYISGICLARGYLHQDTLTNERFISYPIKNDSLRLYQTGDLCQQLPDGNFDCLGRIDHQIKIRGFRVELGEIEQCLLNHSAIQDTVIIPHDNYNNEKQLIAYYSLKKLRNQPDSNALRRYLKTYLADYMIPTVFIKVTIFPLTANGKLDRHALPKPTFSLLSNYLAPRNEVEELLTIVWAEELHLPLVGVMDNFFELGGHSLSGARVITKINQTWEGELSLKELYDAPTIADLAAKIALAQRKDNVASTTTMQKITRILPLSDFQLTIWLSNIFAPNVKKLNVIARKAIQGQIDSKLLNQAFIALLKRHEVLSYHISSFKPAQFPQKNSLFKLVEINLCDLSESESNQRLIASTDELISYYPWPKDSSLLIARLFYLKNNQLELQICMPHVIADDLSLDILFSDLSKLYLLYEKQSALPPMPCSQFKDYIFSEKYCMDLYLDKDILFWQHYLQDASFVSFSKDNVVSNMSARKLPYSTYIPIPQDLLANLRRFCSHSQLSINDVLCAALSQSLSILRTNRTSGKIVINIVKSTRENSLYDQVIGCFLRLEPIVVDLTHDTSLLALAQQIHQAKIDTAPYQRSSGIMKFACMGQVTKKSRLIPNVMSNVIAYLYTKLFPRLKLNHKLLNLCMKLSLFNKRDDFVINLNLWNNFIAQDNKSTNLRLFDLPIKKIKLYRYDLLQLDRVLDVCFLHDDYGIPYLVVSGNLNPVFRTQIAQTLIGTIHAQTPRVTGANAIGLS